LIVLVFPGSHNLNFLNRPVRTRMPGGVAGARPFMADPYADLAIPYGFSFPSAYRRLSEGCGVKYAGLICKKSLRG